MKKSLAIIFIMLITVIFSACSNKNNETLTTETATQEVSETVSGNEENKVLEVYEKVQQAMIDKDIDTLDHIIKDGTTFTHMSGKTQTKEEYFGEIAAYPKKSAAGAGRPYFKKPSLSVPHSALM